MSVDASRSAGGGPAPAAAPDVKTQAQGATIATGTEAKRLSIDDLLYLIRYNPDDRGHLRVINDDICREKCVKYGYACTRFCPAQVYKWEENHVSVSWEGCIECGACRIGCPFANIDWKYPRGGFGVSFKNG